jgi:hypothetical protein
MLHGRRRLTPSRGVGIRAACAGDDSAHAHAPDLFDTKPQFDPSWTSWPFYTRNWFSPVGREFYLSFNYQLPALRR